MNTVLSDQQPRVSFLHYEELRALDKLEEKIHLWRSFFLVSSSLDPSRRTFSDREGGGGVTYRVKSIFMSDTLKRNSYLSRVTNKAQTVLL